MQVQPYLFFEGRCEEALDFYKKAIGAKVEALMRYSEAPADAAAPPSVTPDKVMHAQFTVGDSMVMCSDGMCSGKPQFGGISLSLQARDAAEASLLFSALSQGGSVQMPIDKTFFADAFGMVADRFGVSWMVIAMPEGA